MREIAFHKPYTNRKIESNTLTALKEGWFKGPRSFEYFGVEVPMPHLVQSATAALEIMALAMNIKAGDEIILPSFTYAATANAFAKHGATLVFCDIEKESLNIDPLAVAKLLSKKTKAVVPIHYGGICADLDALKDLCSMSGVYLLEDAAHCIGATYKGNPLGTFGQMGCLSFHSTKNITAYGSGGALWINEKSLKPLVDEIIHQGTNRKAFFDQQVSSYHWKRLGGEYQMSTPQQFFLNESLKDLKEITSLRLSQWEGYRKALQSFEKDGIIRIARPKDYSEGNAHIFYIVLESEKQRDYVQKKMKNVGISCFTHYEPLHTPLDKDFISNRMSFPVTNWAASGILRLPIGPHLNDQDHEYVIDRLSFILKSL